MYKALLDRVTDGVYIVDTDRRIVYWNEVAARQTGHRAAEIVGWRCPEDKLCHADTGGHRLCQDSCPLAASLNDGESHEVEIFLLHKGGVASSCDRAGSAPSGTRRRDHRSRTDIQ